MMRTKPVPFADFVSETPDLWLPSFTTRGRRVRWLYRIAMPIFVAMIVMSPNGIGTIDMIALAVAPLTWLYIERLTLPGRGAKLDQDGLQLHPSGRVIPADLIDTVALDRNRVSAKGKLRIRLKSPRNLFELGGVQSFGRNMVVPFVLQDHERLKA